MERMKREDVLILAVAIIILSLSLFSFATSVEAREDLPNCTLNPLRDTRCVPGEFPVGTNVFIYLSGNRVTGSIWGYYVSPETGLQSIVLIDGATIPTGVFIDPLLVYEVNNATG